jgi:hypothetical protein
MRFNAEKAKVTERSQIPGTKDLLCEFSVSSPFSALKRLEAILQVILPPAPGTQLPIWASSDAF